ncbi:methyltransferase domain-containing protein [Dactylosporangium vinaceum]|nr:methyltransferase domain-containing protein [Dactylosporangium vinaceum]
MLTAVITHLRCPVCREPFVQADRALQCARGHSFDIARQGYADLTAGRPVHTGDTAEMVAAREALLTAGHFAALSTAVAEVVAAEQPGLVLEVGAGTAHYLAAALGDGQDGLAVDTSKAALKRAARAHERIGGVRADIWQGLPLADHTAAVVLDVFAPRSGAEFARVLAPGGALVVATPAADHLAELVAALGLISVDPAKDERLHKSLDRWFVRTHRRRIHDTLRLTRADAEALVGMGPSAWHTDRDAIATALDGWRGPITATLDVDLTVWRPYI